MNSIGFVILKFRCLYFSVYSCLSFFIYIYKQKQNLHLAVQRALLCCEFLVLNATHKSFVYRDMCELIFFLYRNMNEFYCRYQWMLQCCSERDGSCGWGESIFGAVYFNINRLNITDIRIPTYVMYSTYLTNRLKWVI